MTKENAIWAQNMIAKLKTERSDVVHPGMKLIDSKKRLLGIVKKSDWIFVTISPTLRGWLWIFINRNRLAGATFKGKRKPK